MPKHNHKIPRLKSRGSRRLIFLTCLLCLVSGELFAKPVSSTELINNAKQYDGKVINYEGEVIGDIMARGEYAWININDGQKAIGIWVDKNLTKDIFYTGSYKTTGDRIEVTGSFQRACLEHGGDLDIHAQNIRKIRPGKQLVERLNLGKRNQSLVLLAVLLFLIWIPKQLKQK